MSSYVTTKLKHHTDCTIIGQETGGTEIGSNAIIWYSLILPNLKVQVVIPRIFIDHGVSSDKIGRGVMPDIPINYDIQDKLDWKDLELERLSSILNTN